MKQFLLLYLLLLCCYTGRTQQGCLRKGAQQEITLETDIDFSHYNSFLVGEFHGIYGVPEVKLALLKYLNTTCGITAIFMEIGHSAAWRYNRFLHTGDTSWFSMPALPYAITQHDRNFWRRLYAYNLHAAHPVTIYGIDFERIDFVATLRALRPAGTRSPAAIAGILAYIDTVAYDNAPVESTGQFRRNNVVYEKVRAVFAAQRDAFRVYYGDSYAIVANVLLNPNTYTRYSYRNSAMYDNLTAALRENGIKKFAVFCGLNHAGKTKEGTLCSRISGNPDLGRHMATMAMLCSNCYEWPAVAPWKGPLSYSSDTALMAGIYERYYNAGCSYTLLPAGTVADSRVRSFSDYIMLLKDQPRY